MTEHILGFRFASDDVLLLTLITYLTLLTDNLCDTYTVIEKFLIDWLSSLSCCLYERRTPFTILKFPLLSSLRHGSVFFFCRCLSCFQELFISLVFTCNLMTVLILQNRLPIFRNSSGRKDVASFRTSPEQT